MEARAYSFGRVGGHFSLSETFPPAAPILDFRLGEPPFVLLFPRVWMMRGLHARGMYELEYLV